MEFELSLGLMESALKSASVAVIITDDTANIQYVNEQFTQLTGYTCDEVIGRNLSSSNRDKPLLPPTKICGPSL